MIIFMENFDVGPALEGPQTFYGPILQADHLITHGHLICPQLYEPALMSNSPVTEASPKPHWICSYL